MASFSYTVQLASFAPDQVEDRGSAAAEDVLVAFRSFDWSAQVEEANRQQVCNPTFSITNVGNGRHVWLSAYGAPDDVKFVGEYAFQLDEPRILGLGSKKSVARVGAEGQSLDSACQIVQHFLREDHPGLLKTFNSSASAGILNRFSQIFIGLLAFLLGGLVTLTSAAMLFSMLTLPEARTDVLFYVGLVGLAIAPPILFAGVRLILGRPNQYGGLFSPNVLRLLAVVNGLIGLAVLVMAINRGDTGPAIGAITFIATTQGAFILASRRAAG